ncbi:uncharacterized protein BDR25DRAFT_195941, partial [Lindgomyces ingoldianus]
TLVFTHGAGGTLAAPAVVNFCTGYSSLRDVYAFQGSMNLKSRVRGFHACVEQLRNRKLITEKGELELVLGGRSMGSRAAVIAATETISSWREESAGKEDQKFSLILVSYPLVGPKNDIRDKILLDLPQKARVLFVIGERDSMCPLSKLSEVRKKMEAESWLVVIKGADHGMHVKPTKAEKALGVMVGRIAAEWVGGERLAKKKDEKEVAVGWDGESEEVTQGTWE